MCNQKCTWWAVYIKCKYGVWFEIHVFAIVLCGIGITTMVVGAVIIYQWGWFKYGVISHNNFIPSSDLQRILILQPPSPPPTALPTHLNIPIWCYILSFYILIPTLRLIDFYINIWLYLPYTSITLSLKKIDE